MNKNLYKARNKKDDEFYTQIEDIENEMSYYKEHFANKIVYCNCDDPSASMFTRFFMDKFDELCIDKLVSTYIDNNCRPHKTTYKNSLLSKSTLAFNGDFRSPECIEILKECDLVVTNPPFSLFREYIGCLIKHNKKFIIMGNQNAITYKEIFPLLQSGELWLGANYGTMKFEVKSNKDNKSNVYFDKCKKKYFAKFGNIVWFTNLKHTKRNKNIELHKTYSKDEYQMYDNYNAINVDRIKDIPKDYDGIMGVPITFFYHHNPNQFDIIWQASGNTSCSATKETLNYLGYKRHKNDRGGCGVINGKRKYTRIFIKKHVK